MNKERIKTDQIKHKVVLSVDKLELLRALEELSGAEILGNLSDAEIRFNSVYDYQYEAEFQITTVKEDRLKMIESKV